jgi:hypothetical protein
VAAARIRSCGEIPLLASRSVQVAGLFLCLVLLVLVVSSVCFRNERLPPTFVGGGDTASPPGTTGMMVAGATRGAAERESLEAAWKDDETCSMNG